jgi:hypothetical protein
VAVCCKKVSLDTLAIWHTPDEVPLCNTSHTQTCLTCCGGLIAASNSSTTSSCIEPCLSSGLRQIIHSLLTTNVMPPQADITALPAAICCIARHVYRESSSSQCIHHQGCDSPSKHVVRHVVKTSCSCMTLQAAAHVRAAPASQHAPSVRLAATVANRVLSDSNLSKK